MCESSALPGELLQSLKTDRTWLASCLHLACLAPLTIPLQTDVSRGCLSSVSTLPLPLAVAATTLDSKGESGKAVARCRLFLTPHSTLSVGAPFPSLDDTPPVCHSLDTLEVGATPPVCHSLDTLEVGDMAREKK